MSIHSFTIGLMALTVLTSGTATAVERISRASLSVEDLEPGICQTIQFDNNSYIVCPVEMDQHDLRMFHEKGEPSFWGPDVFGHFEEINAYLNPQDQTIAFAMNGGMYHRDRSAAGLYIENGDQSQRLNTNKGAGNFHLLPNGVFFWNDHQAGILETSAFSKADAALDYATQSGPMLVIDGALHPRFIVNGTSLKMRNGVGVQLGGKQVYFALSEQPVNFENFGRLFRDFLKTPNALFLDGGSASQIFAPNLDRNDRHEKLGPIIAVVKEIDKVSASDVIE
ncbi:MAG: phosphodiester glycosidase family protein [Hyphomicrobiales bacterium]